MPPISSRASRNVAGQAMTPHEPSSPEHCPVHVPGHDPANVRVGGEHLGEPAPVVLGKPYQVERRDAGEDGRMVHRDDRRGLDVGGQLRLEPGEPVGRQRALVEAGQRAVHRNEPDAADGHRVAVHARCAEVRAQGVGVIVVSGQRVDGHRQGREQLAGALVLAPRTRLGDVARHHNGVGRRPQRAHRADGGGDGTGRSGVAGADLDVKVGELGEQGRGDRLVLSRRAGSPSRAGGRRSRIRCRRHAAGPPRRSALPGARPRRCNSLLRSSGPS